VIVSKTSNPAIGILTPVRPFQVHAAAHGLVPRFRVGIPELQRPCGDFLRSPPDVYHTALIPHGVFNDPYRLGALLMFASRLNNRDRGMVWGETLRGEARWEPGNDSRNGRNFPSCICRLMGAPSLIDTYTGGYCRDPPITRRPHHEP
jgi:hypothetical protein